MIFEISENSNPRAIFKNNVFYLQEDGEIIVKKNYDKTDSSYYFETPNTNGVIIKKKNGTYYIKACVKYINAKNREMWFAKIRIEEKFGEILLRGDWGGSWQSNDYEPAWVKELKKYNN